MISFQVDTYIVLLILEIINIHYSMQGLNKILCSTLLRLIWWNGPCQTTLHVYSISMSVCFTNSMTNSMSKRVTRAWFIFLLIIHFPFCSALLSRNTIGTRTFCNWCELKVKKVRYLNDIVQNERYYKKASLTIFTLWIILLFYL
jgi:hypothetical protein